MFHCFCRFRIVSITGYSAFSTAFVGNAQYRALMAQFDVDCPLRDIVSYLVRPSSAVQALLEV